MSWDRVWDGVFSSRPWGKYPGEDLIRFVARHFYSANPRSDVRILEIGCGPGANLWYFAREGFATFGIDGSAVAVERAVNRLDEEVPGWRGRVTVGDIKSLPFPGDEFDAVVDCEAISCNSFSDSQTMYREAHRVLKPGGRMFSRTFATGTYGDGTGRAVGPNAWIVGEGPLLNCGYSRFTDEHQIPDLLAPLRVDEVNLMTRTIDGSPTNVVREWVIVATKA